MITSQVIQHLIDDPLVIADLTDHNANVFYELAIRHAVRKHVVLIIDAAQSIPFDVAPNRTIYFDCHDLDSAKRAREEIEQQIKAIEKNPKELHTPLTLAIDLQNLQRSDKPLEKSAADIMAMLQDLKAGLNEIQQRMRKGEVRFLTPQFAVEDFSRWPVGDLSGVNPGYELYVKKLQPTNPPETGKDKKGK
jgi:hypothetical protein